MDITKYKKYYNIFGIEELKSLQIEVIDSLINYDKDILAILATGYGKSICYQLPFLIYKRKKCIIVISPLISLMNDQVTKLLNLGVDAVALNSNLSIKEKEKEQNDILFFLNKIIYISPEYLFSHQDFLIELNNVDRLAFIAIDEVHCVSSYGHDFRQEYGKLSLLKEICPNIKILGLTATASPKIRIDIASSLKIKEYYEIVSSFNRENLYIECKEKTSSIINDFESFTKEYKNNKTIVYVRTRDNTELICNALAHHNIKSVIYHAGLSKQKREEAFDNFISDKVKWIVATVALGMGIDTNIDLVINYGSPGDLDSYYQEIGRAGRSNMPAKCILMFGKGDMRINRILLKDIEDVQYRIYRENQIKYMEEFIRTNECRRKILLKYFGEHFEPPCNNCDNCCNNKNSSFDELNIKIQKTLQYPMFVFRLFLIKTAINSGITKIINVLQGRGGKKTQEFSKTPFYGVGKRYEDNYWKIICDLCILNEYIEEKTISTGFGTIISITQKTKDWYSKILPILKNYKLTGVDYDNYLMFGYLITEEFKISHNVDILRYDKKRNTTLIEDLIIEQQDL